jgi:molecular chaperone DnaK
MYKATQATPGAAPGATGAGPTDGGGAASGTDGAAKKKDEGVIDAEYVDVDEKK